MFRTLALSALTLSLCVAGPAVANEKGTTATKTKTTTLTLKKADGTNKYEIQDHVDLKTAFGKLAEKFSVAGKTGGPKAKDFNRAFVLMAAADKARSTNLDAAKKLTAEADLALQGQGRTIVVIQQDAALGGFVQTARGATGMASDDSFGDDAQPPAVEKFNIGFELN